MSTVKEQVHQIAERLPDDATWEQVRYEVHVREKIEEGEKAVAEGRTLPHDEVRKRFGSGSGSVGRIRRSRTSMPSRRFALRPLPLL